MSTSPPPLPKYYTSFAPFREAFATGNPILTYHKFGPRPRGARLKGLFLPTRLFDRQLTEFRAAGLRSLGLRQSLEDPPGTGVVLTIDDGFRSVREYAQPRLARAGHRALLYLVADRLGGQNDWEIAQGESAGDLMDAEEVRDWLAAGNAIGSHTLTHPWLSRLTPGQAREEISASRRKLEDRFGVPIRDFCYPYGDWSPEVRDWVIEAGYETATTTVAGINAAGADRFTLRRFTARHASRSWRTLRDAWRRWGG